MYKHHLKTAVEVFSYDANNSKELKSEVRARIYARTREKQLISTTFEKEYLYNHLNVN